MTVSTKRRPLLGLAGATVLSGALVSGFTGTATAATPSGAPYGGFTSSATATPLRLEIFEPAIPVPASPQVELNFSWSTVTGSSGPSSTARASAMWPGAAVGEGLPTILTASGLPASLAGGANYPVHVDSQYPGTPNSGSQEFLPGMVGRVSDDDKRAVARVGYSTSGEVAGDSSSGTSLPDVLSQLQKGNIGALGSLLSGPGSSSNTGSNPLGLLSAVISVGGMSSSSVTDYSDPTTVTATATSELGQVKLLGGLVTLSGVKISSISSSSLAATDATQSADYGTLSANGQTFKLTSDGIVAAGNKTATPSLDTPAALAQYGLSITMPKPTKTVSGTSVTAGAAGPTITIDTQPIIKLLQLDKLPLGSIISQLPASANQVKSTLLGILAAHPKIVVELGEVSTAAQTVAALSPGGGGGGGTPTTGTPGGTTPIGGSTGVPGNTGVTGTPNTTSPNSGSTSGSPGYHLASSTPGLPPLGSVPGMLTIGGLILAAGLGWFFRAAALSALGAGSTCPHGLAHGLPDLRKA